MQRILEIEVSHEFLGRLLVLVKRLCLKPLPKGKPGSLFTIVHFTFSLNSSRVHGALTSLSFSLRCCFFLLARHACYAFIIHLHSV